MESPACLRSVALICLYTSAVCGMYYGSARGASAACRGADAGWCDVLPRSCGEPRGSSPEPQDRQCLGNNLAYEFTFNFLPNCSFKASRRKKKKRKKFFLFFLFKCTFTRIFSSHFLFRLRHKTLYVYRKRGYIGSM